MFKKILFVAALVSIVVVVAIPEILILVDKSHAQGGVGNERILPGGDEFSTNTTFTFEPGFPARYFSITNPTGKIYLRINGNQDVDYGLIPVPINQGWTGVNLGAESVEVVTTSLVYVSWY